MALIPLTAGSAIRSVGNKSFTAFRSARTVNSFWFVAFIAKHDLTPPRVRSHSSIAPGAPPLAKCSFPDSSPRPL